MCILDRITFLIKEKEGATQKSLCEYLGISKQAFTNWKNGDNDSYIKYLPRISEYFNVSIDYLLGNIDNKSPIQNKPKITDDDIKFALFGGDVTDEKFEEVKRFAKYIKDLEK